MGLPRIEPPYLSLARCIELERLLTERQEILRVSLLSDQIVESLRQVLGNPPVALHEPTFGLAETENLRACVESTYVSSVGPFVSEFENRVAEYCGAPHALAVSSGTAALHIALLVAGVQPGDEVLVQCLGFVATANAVTYCGAIPHFVDIDPNDLGICPVALRAHLSKIAVRRGGETINRTTGRRISALIPMHTFGHVGQIESLLSVAAEYDLIVVEDAAEAIGSRKSGRHAGTFAELGILSFNGNKTITTGGGGMILFAQAGMAERARHLSTTARVAHTWHFDHDEIGFNYRMPNVNAALGCGQMLKLEDAIGAKRRLFQKYVQAFAHVNGLYVMREPSKCRSNYWLQTIMLSEPSLSQLDEILEATNSSGFQTRPAWKPLSELAPYMRAPRAPISVAKEAIKRILNLPSSSNLA